MKYQSIVTEYSDYEKLQKGKFCSFESSVKKWSQGQRRYIERSFKNVNKDQRILDIACGDGVGLKEFKKRGFKNVYGVEFNKKKAKLAKKIGYPVYTYDMHDLSGFDKESFDVVYSSHTIEHSYYPQKALGQFWNILKPNGKLFVVLPYPDEGHWNDEAHGAKYELGTNKNDNGVGVRRYFEHNGFTVETFRFDNFREPEIWLYCRKKSFLARIFSLFRFI